MRFHSTPESVLNGEITKLAIIECVIAVASYVFIGLYFDTSRHFAVAAAVAPLMLFRTERSVHSGLLVYAGVSNSLHWYFMLHLIHASKKIHKLERYSPSLYRQVSMVYRWASFVLGFLMFIAVAASGVVIRVAATLYWLLRHPLYTLREMPRNWIRQSLCTDLHYPPEILPLETLYAERLGGVPTFYNSVVKRDLVGYVGEERVRVVIAKSGVRTLLVQSPLILLGWIPAIAYRLSFKATFVVYSPFIWVAQVTLRSPPSIKLRLVRIEKGELEKTGRVVSLFVITVLLAKIGLAWGANLTDVLAQFKSLKFVEDLLVPTVWPWWLWALGFASAISFGLFWYSNAALARLDAKFADRWSEEAIERNISITSFLRASLAVLVMLYFFQHAVMAAVNRYFTMPTVTT